MGNDSTQDAPATPSARVVALLSLAARLWVEERTTGPMTIEGPIPSPFVLAAEGAEFEADRAAFPRAGYIERLPDDWRGRPVPTPLDLPAVYFLFAEDGELLYVGCSGTAKGRIKAHLDRRWGDRITHWIIDYHDSMESAHFSEAWEIKWNHPTYNIHHREARP